MKQQNDELKTTVEDNEEKSVSEQVEEVMDEMTSDRKPLVLRKPVMYNGEEINEISFDFNKLSGADALNIDSELRSMGKQVNVAATDADFLIRMARNACDKAVGIDFFKQISIVDFNKIINRARFFLLGIAT